MNKEQVLNFLRENKDLLNLSGIGRAAGFPRLLSVVNGNKDGHGTPATLPERHVKAIIEVLGRLSME